MWIYGSIVFLCCLTVQGEEECEPGKYGDGCSQNCSQNCHPLSTGIVKCHKKTGECFEGCKAGVYGNLCNEPCSKHCLGNTCNMHNGHCARGCIENHIGVFCEVYNGITIVHQGTTSSSQTTVTTGVAPTSSSQVVIPVVVTVLVLLLVGAVVTFIWRRKKKKTERGLYLEDGQEFLSGSPQGGQDTQDRSCMEAKLMKEIQEMKDMLMRKMVYGSPPPSESCGISPVSGTQRECGRRETLRGSNQDDSACSEGIALIPGSSQKSDVHATSGEGVTPMSWTPPRPDTRATPTAAYRYTRVDDDLHVACKEGKLAEVKQILDTDRADINCRGEFGMTPVMWAAEWRHRDVMEILVSRDADVSLVDDDGNNILHWACMGGDTATVEFVLTLGGVDINSRGAASWTPVMWAALRGHRDVVEFLVSRDADVSLVDGLGNNILHCAYAGRDRKTVEFVLSLGGVDINARTTP